MYLYIDPGTGSMLFAILIGIASAVSYAFKTALMKIKFVLSGGRKIAVDEAVIPYVIYSDDKRYWNVFEPICKEFDKRGIDVAYYTSSPDDPALTNPYEHIDATFIGEGNKGFAKLNFLKATILLSTTPGLDVYQWKKSKEVACYVHILHAAGEVVMYRMFGLDYYDAVLVAGECQVNDIRQLEEIRSLRSKDVVITGIPYMDEMVKRLKEAPEIKNRQRTVLLAPSWGPSAIFAKYGEKIIAELLETGYRVVVRPHPQTFISEKDMIDKIMKKYPPSEQLEWNRDNDNFECLRNADILISDFSGVIFDFTLVYDKPIIYADANIDIGPYDAWWLKKEIWTQRTLPKLGMQLGSHKDLSLKEMIDICIEDPSFTEGRNEARAEIWQNYGEGTEKTVDYLVEKYKEVTFFNEVR